MECAAKGTGTACTGPATRRCGGCGAVSYCCQSHQISHWGEHKEECGRLKKQMEHVDALCDFPFTFSSEVTSQVVTQEVNKCSFLKSRGLHGIGIWTYECQCEQSVALSNFLRGKDRWFLSKELCPCSEPSSELPKILSTWKEYYEWRSLPLSSPVALLLHWPLSIYYGIQLANRGISPPSSGELRIHYLGPEKELHQLPAFGELRVLFPGVNVSIELVGPSIPQNRDGEHVILSGYAKCLDEECKCKFLNENKASATHDYRLNLRLWRGFYHDRFRDILKDGLPHYIIGPNAGIAAYASWKPTVELIRNMNLTAIFSDYSEEAAHLAAHCISTVTGHSLSLPIQLNPFRQPFMVEDAALCIPCFSNCFLFGM
ncbi:unnamed protein product [Victoria cruziana]